ncbi:FemAB family protein [Planococcus massiliensis]|uniref:Lipid II:glycine glycyltransferase n=1 Tax=Planococcus massiliensis TaxID=1499687 RepID=A0A098EIJ7_9BACL|nr:GNAT family N-acetyltransferase [Planococcus massiliensis]MCJ1908362.1 GNAT family N-acetyltransferase [Planococcus ruber]CEG22103.1 FemAB family protein [Planococcus massiliensis]
MDIYYKKNYGLLYEQIENGTCEVFDFKSSTGSVRHLFIKKEIPLLLNGSQYFDISSPYGYGGPLITSCQEGKRNLLAKEFEAAFSSYCEEQQIVSEFVRFHPLFSNARDFSACYELAFKSFTTGTALAPYQDPIQHEFSKSTRKTIRKALKAGVTYRITKNPDSLAPFRTMYVETMKRIGAHDIYFFDDKYFAKCLEYFGDQIILAEAMYEGKVIGMELHFHFNKWIHTHLSATIEEFHHLAPVYVLTYAIAEWGKSNDAELIHSGGGKTSDPDDSLYLFKKKFGQNTQFEYYTGTRIWNEKIYSRLCDENGSMESDFFPAYRSPAGTISTV